MSHSTEQLREVVGSFVSAEESLRRLEAKRAALADAAERFRDADDSMRSTTEDAVRSLANTQGLLDNQIVALNAVVSHTDEVVASTAELVAGLGQAVAQLQRIDPDRFMSDLAELRRDMTDSTVEVREARRAASGAQDAASEAGTKLDSLAASAEATREATGRAAQAMNTRVDAVAESLAGLRNLVIAVLVVGGLSLVLSLVAVLRG